MEARRKRKNSFIIFEWLGAGMLAIVLIVLVFWYWKDYKSMKLSEPATFYFMGDAYSYDAGTKLDYNGKNVTVKNEDSRQETILADAPLILNTGKGMILTTNMSYHTGKPEEPAKKVNYFTHLTNQSRNAIVITHEDRTIDTAAGFLYDGDNLYIFLEPMTIYIGESEYDADALSYIKTIGQNQIELYLSNTNSCKNISGDVPITAEAVNHEYTVHVDTDIVNAPSMEWILFSGIDSLDVL